MAKENIVFDYSKLRGAMGEKGVSRRDLASRIPMDAGYLGNVLSSGKTMSSITILRIAQILELPNVDDYFFTLKVQ